MSVQNQAIYKGDLIADYARRKATLIPTVHTDTQERGGTTIFLVGGDGGRTAKTRGPNGLIPPSDDSQTQVTLTFKEYHDLNEKTGFDLFRAQGDQLDLMRMNSLAVIHREQDREIIAAITTGTVTLGTLAGPITQAFAAKIAVTLANANVGLDDGGHNIFNLVTPATWAELWAVQSFANSDYVNFGPQSPIQAGMPQHGTWKYWLGMNWAEHTGLDGVGTATATNLAWHKNAVGYSTSSAGLQVETGEDRKQDATWARATIYHAGVKLQNPGIVKWVHNDELVLA